DEQLCVVVGKTDRFERLVEIAVRTAPQPRPFSAGIDDPVFFRGVSPSRDGAQPTASVGDPTRGTTTARLNCFAFAGVNVDFLDPAPVRTHEDMRRIIDEPVDD